jgi:acyl transferase domain-containing protein
VKDAQVELQEAIASEARAHELLLAGDWERARAPLSEAVERYRRSWELAPPTAYGRLIGVMKAAILAGQPDDAADYVRRELAGLTGSPTGAYALALAALVEWDDPEAVRQAATLRAERGTFERAAEGIDALAARHRDRYAAAIAAIVTDFEERAEHLTGIAIADTALCLELLAEPRGLASGVRSPLLPAR